MESEFPALWNAIRLGSRDRMVQILLEYGATIDVNSKDRNVLIAAAREGLLTAVQLLLNHGADINTKNDDNETPLIMAARFAHEDLVLFLVGQGARFNVADFRVWLRKMAQIPGKRWSTGVVQTILHHVTDICWRGEDGGILLSLAVAFADHEIIQVCLAEGVDVNRKHPNGATALFEAMLEWGSGGPNTYYRYSGYLRRDVNHRNKKSPTMIAGRLAIAAVLMDHGADVNVSADFNDDSQRPLLVAAASLGVDWAVQALIEYGADCNARAMVIRNPESTRRRFASVFRRVSNEQEPEDMAQGGSALIYAARWGYVSTLRLLLAHGADTSFVDEYGKTALEWALEFEHREIEQMLMEHDKAMGCSVT
ncbi:ankyrin repeat [Fusarium phyllophilum]|uniref:Ankyrin repeat n=1 Tax=Fusarium phyllophilum TaxID=47803 RepID=A0A8H5IE90_9HYPO|nr:ankyrin repeat [Fusarium phyllophilum]